MPEPPHEELLAKRRFGAALRALPTDPAALDRRLRDKVTDPAGAARPSCPHAGSPREVGMAVFQLARSLHAEPMSSPRRRGGGRKRPRRWSRRGPRWAARSGRTRPARAEPRRPHQRRPGWLRRAAGILASALLVLLLFVAVTRLCFACCCA